MLKGASSVAIVAALSAVPVGAMAQDREEEEVVVTANRRAEAVQDVASSVTAISEQQLEARGIDGFEGFARSVPGLTMNQAVKNRAIFNIRGIATGVVSGNTQDPVSVYINDTPITDTFAAVAQPDLRLFDVNRVEVLRGPQGTLFGSGSLGGTIRIITNKPNARAFEASGRVDLGVTKGGGLRQRYDAMVNVPLVADRLALRVVGYYRNEEGWVENTRLGTRNDTIDWGGRVALQWTPADNLTVRAEAFHQNSDPEDGDSWDPALGKFKRNASMPEPRPNRITNYNLAVDYDFSDFATLNWSSTYQESKSGSFRDIGPLLGPGSPHFLGKLSPWKGRFFVQELRLVSTGNSPFQWVAGGFFIDRKTSIPDYRVTAPGLDDFFGGALGSDLFFDTDITTKSTEIAGYFDGNYEIANGLKLGGGLRVFRTTADYIEQARTSLNFATLRYEVTAPFANHSRSTNTTWRAGVSYEPNRDLLFYGNVSKGFRIGQVNANRGASLIDPADYVISEGYAPDSTINYEIGAKTSWLQGALTLNAAAFYIDWKNIQIEGTRRSDFAAFTANGGRASVKGLEFEMTARPGRGVSLYASVTVQDGKIDAIPAAFDVPAAVGDRLPGLAQWKLSGGVEYRWRIGSNEAHARIDGQFTDRSPNDFSNAGRAVGFAMNDSHSSLNAAIGMDLKWGSVAAYVENLTNEDAIILRIPNVPAPYVTLRPRTFGVRLTVRR